MSSKKNRRKTVVKKNDEPAVQENPIDKIRQMEAELETLKKGRIKELLAQRETIEKELRQLGYVAREAAPTAPKAEAKPKAKTTGKKRGRQPGSVVKCSICGQEGHTKRTHDRYVAEQAAAEPAQA